MPSVDKDPFPFLLNYKFCIKEKPHTGHFCLWEMDGLGWTAPLIIPILLPFFGQYQKTDCYNYTPPFFFGGGGRVHSLFHPPPPPPISWHYVLIVQATSTSATYLLLTLDNGGPRPHGFTTKIYRCLKCWFWILQTLVNRLSCLKKYRASNPRVFGLFWLCFYVARSLVKTATGGVQIIGRNSRFIGYFVTKTKKNTEKNTRRFKVNSSSIRQYAFCLEIQSINCGNPAFFDPSFNCTFRSHRTLLPEVVFLWA